VYQVIAKTGDHVFVDSIEGYKEADQKFESRKLDDSIEMAELRDEEGYLIRHFVRRGN
jgi:hypothetical protein